MLGNDRDHPREKQALFVVTQVEKPLLNAAVDADYTEGRAYSWPTTRACLDLWLPSGSRALVGPHAGKLAAHPLPRPRMTGRGWALKWGSHLFTGRAGLEPATNGL
jgi:hypothetical protein